MLVYEYFFGLNPVKFSQFSFLLYGITLSIKYLIKRFRLMLSPLRKASKSNVNGPIDRYMTHIMHYIPDLFHDVDFGALCELNRSESLVSCLPITASGKVQGKRIEKSPG